MADQTVSTEFIVLDKTTRPVKTMTGSLKEYDKTTQTADKSSKGLGVSLGGVAKGFAAVAAAVGAAKIANAAKELGELGAKAQFVEKNFENFAKNTGRSVEGMTADLRAATQNMVSDLELQQFAMQSMISGVKFEDMITAMQYVSRQAAATGADVAQKMQTVMTGFARGSAEFLDDVGIQVMGAKDVVGAAVEQMKQKMDLFADAAGTATGNIQSTKTEIENVRAAIGADLIPMTENWYKVLLGGWKVMQDIVDQIKQGGTTKLTAISADEFNRMRETAKAQVGLVDQIKKSVELQKKLADLRKAAATETKLSSQILAVQTKGEKASAEMIERAKNARKEESRLLKEIKEATGFNAMNSAHLLKVYDDLNPKIKDVAGGLKKAKEELNEFQKLAKTTPDMGAISVDIDPKFRQEQILKQLKDTLEKQRTMEEKAAKDRLDLAHKLAAERVAADQPMIDLQNEITAYEQEQAQARIEIARQEQQAKFQFASQMMTNMVSLVSAFSSARIGNLNAEANAEKEAIRQSNMSRKKQAQEIAKIDAKLAEDKRKAAMATYVAQVAAATGNVGLAIGSVMAQEPGGVIKKLAAAATIAGAVTSALTTVIGSKPRFFNGGEVPSNGMTGDSQLALVRSGERVLTPAENAVWKAGSTTTNNSRVNNVTVNVNVAGGDPREVEAAVVRAIPRAIEIADQQGRIDYSRLSFGR